MAKVIAIGHPINDSERQAIAHLRDHLPNSFTILHNFEIRRGNEFFEVDLAIVAPHAIYLVDVKGTRGNIDVYGSKWYPENRQPFSSPLAKLRGHAKVLSGLISDSNHADPELRKVYCTVAVVMTAPDAHISDPGGRDVGLTTTLSKSVRFFQNSKNVPDRFLKNIRKYSGTAIKAIQGVSKPITKPQQFGDYVVSEKLGGTDRVLEYRAYNSLLGKASGSVLLRVYPVDPLGTEDEREKSKILISNGYKALKRMPTHPSIQTAHHFTTSEDEDRYVLVVDDTAGQSLRLHIEKPSLALTFDQKLRVARDLLTGVTHCHKHSVIHRNICPSNVLFGADGQMRLINFDFARSGVERSNTIAEDIVDELESEYQSPQCFKEPSAASNASDVFSVGAVLYEMFTGERPFSDASEIFDQEGVFAIKPSQHNHDLPEGFDEWLQAMCKYAEDERPSAREALEQLEKILSPPSDSGGSPPTTITHQDDGDDEDDSDVDYQNLAAGFELTKNYVVQEKLGSGGFSVVYKVIDTLGDVARVVKIILPGKYSSVEKVRQEFKTLNQLPNHKRVVQVVHPGFLRENIPYITFEFVDGLDVNDLIKSQLLNRNDAWEMGKHVAEGLAHLHKSDVYHCDIKPGNVLWTGEGARIIDFNVSVRASDDIEQHGGTRKYIPPDYEYGVEPSTDDLRDRDLFAFGVTLYQAVTGKYPWEATTPIRGEVAKDPRVYAATRCQDLPVDVVELLQKVTHPQRSERFHSADEILTAMNGIKNLRLAPAEETEGTLTWNVPPQLKVSGSDKNAFLDVLLTFYSQGKNNKGTRGLALDGEVYVETALDRELIPATLSGEFKLVVITGNAGDGKTAFLEKLQRTAAEKGATVTAAERGNGAVFELDGRKFLSNYDGSQDEGEVANEEVLSEFLSAFKGEDSSSWPGNETRLIAINEGRLVDFLETNSDEFPKLLELVQQGLTSGQPADGIALINLNLRSVVAEGVDGQLSILERLLKRMTHKKFWKRCDGCGLKDKCYVLHNVKTFQDDSASASVIERLKALYTLTVLRGRQHITLRDLGSALAYMLVGSRNCEEIHELYSAGNPKEIIDGFYFNSWMGGDRGSADRLLSLLAEVDVGKATNPRLDRSLDLQALHESKGQLGFEHRGSYDTEILSRLYSELPWNVSGRPDQEKAQHHRSYVAMVKRRHFFERMDDGWRSMIGYRSADQMLQLVRGELSPEEVLPGLIRAINLGEGLSDPAQLEDKLVLQIRDVPSGSMRSYRLFPVENFELIVEDTASLARFVEHMPSKLTLRFNGDSNSTAELDVNLDVFEMLYRLNQGYRPTAAEQQGYYLSLSIFKNILSSAPYQEILLTTSGQEFFRIEREESGKLRLEQTGTGV